MNLQNVLPHKTLPIEISKYYESVWFISKIDIAPQVCTNREIQTKTDEVQSTDMLMEYHVPCVRIHIKIIVQTTISQEKYDRADTNYKQKLQWFHCATIFQCTTWFILQSTHQCSDTCTFSLKGSNLKNLLDVPTYIWCYNGPSTKLREGNVCLSVNLSVHKERMVDLRLKCLLVSEVTLKG